MLHVNKERVIEQQSNETVNKQCTNCFSIYPVPVNAGCTICPACGQRACGE
jgi:rRNA maturation endonuclease Nob1